MELQEEVFHRMEDNFHTEDLVAAATLVAVVEMEDLVGLDTLAGMDTLAVRLVDHQGAHLGHLTTHRIPMVTGLAAITAIMGSLQALGPGITKAYMNSAWRKICRSGRGQNPGSIVTGCHIKNRSWRDW